MWAIIAALFSLLQLMSFLTAAVPDLTTCKVTKPGQEYVGTLNTTKTGLSCLEWTNENETGFHLNDDQLPDPSVLAANNYCRNPDGSPDGPWCFAIDGTSITWEYCNVSYCFCKSVADCVTCPTHGVCTECFLGYGVNKDGRCSPCSDNSGCAQCTNMTVCTKCQSSSLGPDLQSGVDTCSPCSSNCRVCAVNGAGKCDVCKSEFFLGQNKTCKPCSPNCKICTVNGAGKCDACKTAYVLQADKTCRL